LGFYGAKLPLVHENITVVNKLRDRMDRHYLIAWAILYVIEKLLKYHIYQGQYTFGELQINSFGYILFRYGWFIEI